MTDPIAPLLTSNGAAIPALGFGTSPMTGTLSADEVLAALRAGYRHIDTAWKYGTERAVGQAIRASGVPRQDIFLTTKVSHEYLRTDDFARSVDESLATLQVDSVDLLMVHWPNPEVPLAETMTALAKAKRQGLARHIGVANFNIALLDQAIRLCPEPLVALQAEYHPYLDQSKLVAAARARGLVYVVYCPLGRGRLFSDKVLAETMTALAKAKRHPYLDQSKLLAAARARGLVYVAYCPLGRGRLFGDKVLADIAQARGRTVAQVALRWLMQQDVAAIPRSSNPQRIADNFKVFDFTLSDEEMERIFALRRTNGRIANPVERVAGGWD
jgi:diketogulonate reductase-like aldo/keto reductase